MFTALELPRTWVPEVPHTLVVVVTTVVVVLLVTALLVATGLMVQDLTGGPSPAPFTPEAGLDL